MFYVIIACEVAFWVVIAAGLAARYLLKWRRVSAVLLLSTPLIDLTLLAFSIADLRSGGEGGTRHALAAVYLGYTIMFGHRTIKWADAKASQWLGLGPGPAKPPTEWLPRAWYEFKFWLRIVGMYAIAWAVTGLFVLVVGEVEATEPVMKQLLAWGVPVVIAALWPITYFLFPSKRGEQSSRSGEGDARRQESAASTVDRSVGS